MATCTNVQQSLDWCMGTPELPGIKKRIYYIAKNQIASWPKFVRDSNGRATSATLSGSFTLVADATWKFITVLADKSQLTSEAQGETPSQTQLNKITAVHPSVGAEAAAAAAYLNNTDSVFIIEDMKGNFRIVGSDRWQTKTTVAQDNGQGPTGSTSTTINVEATDEMPSPFYVGTIVTDDGEIDCSTGTSTETSGGSSSSSGAYNGGSVATDTSTKYTLTLVANPTAGGTVTGGGQYSSGTNVTITATPKSGYTFTKWSDGNTSASRNIVVTSNSTLTATFTSTGGSSSGDGDDDGAEA